MKNFTSFSNTLSALSLASCLVSFLTPVSPVAAAPAATVLASVSSLGEQGNNESSSSALSANGRFLAFVSYANNLVPEDNNAAPDIFVHDFRTRLTRRVSVSSEEVEGNGYSSYAAPAISADGRFVAFASLASNLVAGDNNNSQDVFVRDLKSGATQRVSLSSEGFEGNDYSYPPSLSANGRFVIFSSFASNLVEGDNNNAEDVFVHDLKTGETQRVSVDSSGAEGNSGSGYSGIGGYVGPNAITNDGSMVAFASMASNLVPGDNNGLQDVFVRNLKTGAIQRVSVNSAGEEASGSGYESGTNCSGDGLYFLASWEPSISANGRFVAFTSTACNLVEGDTNDDFIFGGPDVFVHDLKTGETRLVSISNSGEQFTFNGRPAISASGRFVAFSSSFGGHSTLYGDLTSNVVVHDLKAGLLQIVSVDNGRVDENYDYGFGNYEPSISASGRFISFSSDATNIVRGDVNGAKDVFVRRLW